MMHKMVQKGGKIGKGRSGGNGLSIFKARTTVLISMDLYILI